MSDKACARCKAETPTYDYDTDSTFWGWFTTKTRTTVERSLRLRATYYRRNPRFGSPMLVSDEEQALCSDCWGLFVGRFLQGRDVPAREGKSR